MPMSGEPERSGLKIVFADDHDVIRAGLVPFLKKLAAETEVFEAASFDEVIRQVHAIGSADLVIVDLKMPGMNGVSGLKALRKRFPKVALVVFSGSEGRSDILQAVEVGADGFVPKSTSCEAVVNALRLVLSGERYFPISVMAPRPRTAGRTVTNSGATDQVESLAALSAREGEILAMLCDCDSNKELARRLGITEITVKTHLTKIYRKIGAANRAHAVKIALQLGLDA